MNKNSTRDILSKQKMLASTSKSDSVDIGIIKFFRHLLFSAGMEFFMNISQVLISHMSINLSGTYVSMT